MKNLFCFAILLAAPGWAPASLPAAETKPAKPQHSEEEAWSFKAGRGVTLGPDGLKALGIATAEVQSATVTPDVPPAVVQIYRAASEGSAPHGKSFGSCFLKSPEAKLLSAGQAFELHGGGSVFAASVATVKPADGSGLAEVLVTIDDPKAELRAGGFLEARLAGRAGARPGVTVVPVSSVVDSVRGPFVYAVNGGSFLRTPVKPGARQAGVVEILDGLFEGDVVVTNGAPGLWMVELQAVNGGKGCGDAH